LIILAQESPTKRLQTRFATAELTSPPAPNS
jgi:hypothetical protein